MPAIDVLVPCYNYGRFLPDAVHSILSQDVDGLRVMVIDDASTDGSAAVARRLAAEDRRVTVRVHEANRGHIATYNEGIAAAAGDYFLLLSADDLLTPGALARAVALMEAEPGVAMTHGHELMLSPGIDPNDLPRAADGPAEWLIASGDAMIEVLCSLARNVVGTGTAVVRTSAQKRAGPYRADLPHAGDLEMWLRIARQGDVAVTRTAQAIRRMHGSNMSVGYTAVATRDLHQRRDAFDSFFATDAADDPNRIRLRRLARTRLAESVFCWGAALLRKGEFGHGLTLLTTSLALAPSVPLDTLVTRFRKGEAPFRARRPRVEAGGEVRESRPPAAPARPTRDPVPGLSHLVVASRLPEQGTLVFDHLRYLVRIGARPGLVLDTPAGAEPAALPAGVAVLAGDEIHGAVSARDWTVLADLVARSGARNLHVMDAHEAWAGMPRGALGTAQVFGLLLDDGTPAPERVHGLGRAAAAFAGVLSNRLDALNLIRIVHRVPSARLHLAYLPGLAAPPVPLPGRAPMTVARLAGSTAPRLFEALAGSLPHLEVDVAGQAGLFREKAADAVILKRAA
ncbi:glycosyltransferase family 2 protein [Methylobacterium sp. Gmos1]